MGTCAQQHHPKRGDSPVRQQQQPTAQQLQPLLNNSADFAGVTAGDNDIIGQDPLLNTTGYVLNQNSPAIDMAHPLVVPPSAVATAPIWGGAKRVSRRSRCFSAS